MGKKGITDEGTSNIIDYKFHCLNGEPQFVLVCSERKAIEGKGMQVKLDLFDMDWHAIKALRASGNEVPGDGKIACPEKFSDMKEMARVLSQDFKFVRVDLYEINGRVYFGELTFSPACCVFPYFSEKFLDEMGKLLSI